MVFTFDWFKLTIVIISPEFWNGSFPFIVCCCLLNSETGHSPSLYVVASWIQKRVIPLHCLLLPPEFRNGSFPFIVCCCLMNSETGHSPSLYAVASWIQKRVIPLHCMLLPPEFTNGSFPFIMWFFYERFYCAFIKFKELNHHLFVYTLLVVGKFYFFFQSIFFTYKSRHKPLQKLRKTALFL